jgi:hypothetical protein
MQSVGYWMLLATPLVGLATAVFLARADLGRNRRTDTVVVAAAWVAAVLALRLRADAFWWFLD